MIKKVKKNRNYYLNYWILDFNKPKMWVGTMDARFMPCSIRDRTFMYGSFLYSTFQF